MTANEQDVRPGVDLALPSPAEVEKEFARLAAEDAEAATSYLYQLGLESGYVRAEDIARNVCWTAETDCGPLEITINLSKPEKDPRAIAAAAKANGADASAGVAATEDPAAIPSHAGASPAPQCAICWENEGWPGSDAFPAKPLLRIASIELEGEEWGLQYSPYAYFEEHCIALSREHRPMKIDAACFARLLDFADLFPFYFIGSNADLPIVGGSILSHDHFQGGRHEFPLMRAGLKQRFTMPAFPAVECGVVDWPASVVRLASQDREELLGAASAVLDAWRNHEDAENSILPRSKNGTPHNTVSPIARKMRREDGSARYAMDLVLRNNRTTAERPWGLFHPREELHHIKKENIGLIEIMGLAILPPRLARELPAVQQLLHVASEGKFTEEGLFSSLCVNAPTEPHASWAMDVFARRKEDLRAETSTLVRGQLSPVMREEVAAVFAEVLRETAVFKNNDAGTRGWNRFVAKLTASA